MTLPFDGYLFIYFILFYSIYFFIFIYLFLFLWYKLIWKFLMDGQSSNVCEYSCNLVSCWFEVF